VSFVGVAADPKAGLVPVRVRVKEAGSCAVTSRFTCAFLVGEEGHVAVRIASQQCPCDAKLIITQGDYAERNERTNAPPSSLPPSSNRSVI
jgi:hypothetical protein